MEANQIEAWLLDWFVEFGLVKSIENLVFSEPHWLWLILLWPVLWLINWLFSHRFDIKDDLAENRNQSKLVVKHNLIHLMKSSNTVSSPHRSSFVTDIGFQFLRGLIIALIAVSLANPVELLPKPPKPQTKTVRDIVFVIESSASFLLPDYEINGRPETRMNVVKEVLDQFIAKLEGNRFSIAIYADKAYTLLPMTYDQTLARLSLKRLKPYLAGRTDIAMGEALGLALKQTDAGLQIASKHSDTAETSGRKKILVLISDGLSLPSRLELSEAVNYAQLLKVPVYTIGVGSSSQTADKREFSGLLYQALESESLQQIASQTSARYYRVGSGKEISEVLEQINRAEGVPYTPSPSPPQTRSLMHYPLIVAAGILAFYWLLSLILAGRSSRVVDPKGEAV
jgi:Ca-activated chloride channel family protein